MIPSLLALVSPAPSKTMTTLILSIARAIVLLYTTCKRFIYSPLSPLWILVNLVVIILFLLHRFNSKHAIQAPLFSFPSLSQPIVSFASISMSQPLFSFRSLSQPLFSLPSLSLQTIFGVPPYKKGFPLPDTPVASAPPLPPELDVLILESISYQDRNIYAGMESAPDEEGSMSIDDTWNAILASGGVKPVKSKKSEKHDGILERVDPKVKVENSVIGKKKKKRAEKVEERVEGWRKRDALVIPHDYLSRRAEAFIKKQYDYLKLQREESNQHRLLERLRVSDNAL